MLNLFLRPNSTAAEEGSIPVGSNHPLSSASNQPTPQPTSSTVLQ